MFFFVIMFPTLHRHTRLFGFSRFLARVGRPFFRRPVMLAVFQFPYFPHNYYQLLPLSEVPFSTPGYIGKIIGISSTGLDVASKSFIDDQEKTSFVKSMLSFLGSEDQILEAAEAFVETELQYPTTKEQADSFKMAFVIFVMGLFLAPSATPCHGKTDFWGALAIRDQIGAYNWSSYVMTRIFEAARMVTWDTAEHRTVQYITSCPLIMQVYSLQA